MNDPGRYLLQCGGRGLRRSPASLSKAGAKVDTFIFPTKLFQHFFQRNFQENPQLPEYQKHNPEQKNSLPQHEIKAYKHIIKTLPTPHMHPTCAQRRRISYDAFQTHPESAEKILCPPKQREILLTEKITLISPLHTITAANVNRRDEKSVRINPPHNITRKAANLYTKCDNFAKRR